MYLLLQIAPPRSALHDTMTFWCSLLLKPHTYWIVFDKWHLIAPRNVIIFFYFDGFEEQEKEQTV